MQKKPKTKKRGVASRRTQRPSTGASASVTNDWSTATKQYCPQSKKTYHQDHNMQKKHASTFANQGSDVVPVVLNGPVVTTIHHDLPKIGKGPFAITLSDPQLNVASHLCDNVNLKACPNAAGWKKSKQTTHANPNQSNKQHAMSLNVFSTYFHAIHPAIFFPWI